ncbi:MAG: hypothetical protein GY946_20925 [bacterium]|nr:hypothetical protein [bacterium]
MADPEPEPFGSSYIELHIGAEAPSAPLMDQNRTTLTQPRSEATGVAIANRMIGGNKHNIDRSDESSNRRGPGRTIG